MKTLRITGDEMPDTLIAKVNALLADRGLRFEGGDTAGEYTLVAIGPPSKSVLDTLPVREVVVGGKFDLGRRET